jgi:hypothetical protein
VGIAANRGAPRSCYAHCALVTHDQADNARLAQLLLSDPKYRDLKTSWIDSASGISYIGNPANNESPFERTYTSDKDQPSAIAHMNEESGFQDIESILRQYQQDSSMIPDNGIVEALHWAPRSVVRIAHRFASTLIPSVPSEAIRHFLQEVNQEWHTRELQHVKRVRAYYKSQLKDVRRQLQNARPYTDVCAHSRVQGLQTQMKQQRHQERTRVRANVAGKGIASNSLNRSRSRMTEISRDKMLEVSLTSLERLSKRVRQFRLCTPWSLRENFVLDGKLIRPLRHSARDGRRRGTESGIASLHCRSTVAGTKHLPCRGWCRSVQLLKCICR